MNILMVVHSLPRSGGAGTENYTRQICMALQQKQHQVTVLARGEPFFDGPASSIHLRKTHPFPVYTFFRHPSDGSTPEKEYWNTCLDPAFSDLLTSIKPDIVHFQHCINLSISLVSTASQLGFPVFFTLHDFWILCPDIILVHASGKPCTSYSSTGSCRTCITLKHRAPRIWLSGRSFYARRRQRMMEAVHACDNVLALSETVRNAAVKAGFDPKRILSWKTGINTNGFFDKRNLATQNHPIRFAFTGTLSPQKGVETAIKAFHRLPRPIAQRARLTIYGDMEADAETKRIVTRWKNRYAHSSIIFAGSFNHDELPEILKHQDVIIVPSTWYENRPLSILESLAAGNPVIGTGLGGIRELIETPNAGWTFPPGDDKTLAKQMASIITHPESIMEKRRNIPDITSIDEDASNLENLYKRHLRSHRFCR
jgi:glycosyltransferase involved in cell wall biosynthesis